MKKILVTGAAGFIGFHLISKLAQNSYQIYGLDNINDYYDTKLKYDRLDLLKPKQCFIFDQIDVSHRDKFLKYFSEIRPDIVIHLAAQAGVRYSISHPYSYLDSNLVGFLNLLEASKKHNVEHLIFASSSSVYGANTKVPFSESDNVDHPVSLYAATKKANELLAHSYANLYKIPVTGLRFFTVYGPYGRPDMAYFSFTKNIIEGKTIDVYNSGNLYRDFTYIDDIVNGIEQLLFKPPTLNVNWDREISDPSTSFAPYRILNIGNNEPIKLSQFIETLEKTIGINAEKVYLPMQQGDVETTYADTTKLYEITGFKPYTSIEVGLKKFVDWYKSYYKIG